MSTQQTLQQQLLQGGELKISTQSLEEVLALAEELELTAFSVECDRARNRSAVFRAVVKAVDFPEFFGGNLDSLYDCLSDTVLDQKDGLFLWFNKLHSGDPALEEDVKAIIDVCLDVSELARNNDKVFSFYIDHAGKHPDPEEITDSPTYEED